jgi:hypothetical protein
MCCIGIAFVITNAGDTGEAQECSSNEENSNSPTFGNMLRFVTICVCAALSMYGDILCM